MKKTCFNTIYAVICMALAFVVGACGDKTATAEDFIALGASDDAIVMTGHLSDVLRNAACKTTAEGIEFSPAIEKIMQSVCSPSEKMEIGKIAKVRGVDFNNCFLKFNGEDCVFAIALNDANAFRQWLDEDMEADTPENEGDYAIYVLDSSSKCFVNDGAAYLVVSGNGACNLEFFNSLKEHAAANPLASWQVDVLKQHKTCSMLVNARKFFDTVGSGAIEVPYYNLETIKKGTVELTAELKGMKFNLTMKMHDADGKIIKAEGDFKPIDLKVFDYMNAGDLIAAAINLGGDIDWNKILEAINQQTGGNLYDSTSKPIVDKVVEVLNNVDGTVFISAHPKDMMRMTSGPQYWSGTIGVEMKKGAATQYIDEIKSLAMHYAQVSTQGDATVITLAPYVVYLQDVDGMFVMSTEPITGKDGAIVVKDYFKDRVIAMELTLEKGTDFGMGALPFQPVLAISGTGDAAAFDIELIGDGEYLLDTLLTYIAANAR